MQLQAPVDYVTGVLCLYSFLVRLLMTKPLLLSAPKMSRGFFHYPILPPYGPSSGRCAQWAKYVVTCSKATGSCTKEQ